MTSERKIHLKSVGSWGELTPGQLLKVAKIMARRNYESSLKVKVFLSINGLKIIRGKFSDIDIHTDGYATNNKYYKFKKRGCKPFAIERNLVTTLIKSFDWLDDEITLLRNYPKIAGRKACEHRLYNSTLEQFLFADQIYANYVATGRAIYLRHLNAIFYNRGKFKTSKVRKKAFRFRFVRKSKLYTTFIWYTAVKRWIMNKYPYLFNGSGSDETPPDESIMNMLSALNQGHITENPKILKSDVHYALHQLNLMTEKATSKNV